MTQYPAQSNPSRDKTRARGDINAQQTEKKQKMETQEKTDKASSQDGWHSTQENGKS
jgi:hypothetical protein